MPVITGSVESVGRGVWRSDEHLRFRIEMMTSSLCYVPRGDLGSMANGGSLVNTISQSNFRHSTAESSIIHDMRKANSSYSNGPVSLV